MNLFSNDVLNGMFNAMNSIGYGKANQNQKQIILRNNLDKCTYPDQVKYGIEKSVKQLFHVYPFFNPDLLMFVQNGVQKRFIELKGILEIQIKGKLCKVDFNMMLGGNFPRQAPFVRIVNRNPDYKIDPFYKTLQSKTDPSSFVLNQKLNSVKIWHPSNSLVNVIIECYELLKNRFPFSKPVQQVNSYGSGNAWDALYKKQENFGGGGFNNANNWGNNNNQNNSWTNQNNSNSNNSWGNQNNNNGWSNQNNIANNGWSNQNNTWGTQNNNNWQNQPQNNGNNWVNSWGNNNKNNGWAPNNPTTNNNSWGTNNNNGWNANTGGMGGIIPGGNNAHTNLIVAAQKFVSKQKQILAQLNNQNIKLIPKSQQLDILTKSLQSQASYLRRQNFQMTNFLNQNEQNSQILSLASIVQPKDELSEQILDLLCNIKAREQCSTFLQSKFNQQLISLQQFLKQLRKIQQTKFQQKYLLQKCLKHNS